MKRSEFRYDVKAQVIFTVEETLNMMKCSEEHYDGLCKAASRRGGFLYGMANAFVVWVEEDPDHVPTPRNLSWREVDTLCKILEGPGADRELARNMRQLLSDLSDEERRINSL